MEKVIEGIYENGTVTLTEPPPATDKAKVVVIFIEHENEQMEIVINRGAVKINSSNKLDGHPSKGVRLGSLEGKISIPDDFNEPLEDFADYM